MDWKNKVNWFFFVGIGLFMLLALSISGFAQSVINEDSLRIAEQIDTLKTSEKIEGIIWPERIKLSSNQILNDSLLRWTPLRSIDWVLKQEPGYRVYSTGTLERQTALYKLTNEPRHLRLFSEGLDLRDPITGQIDFQRLSPRKLRSLSESYTGAGVEWNATFREHYLNEPRLYLFFDENGSNVRDLEILYTHNFQKNLNIELGYHDLRDGLSFYGMNVTSGLIHARTAWQISPHLRIKAGINTRKREADESFGYTNESLFTFSFNPLIVRPLQSEFVESNSFDSFIRLEREGIGRSHRNPSRFTIGLYSQSSDMFLETLTDTLDSGFGRFELHSAYEWKGQLWRFETSLRNRFEQINGTSLDGLTSAGNLIQEKTISTTIAEGDVAFSPTSSLLLYSRVYGQKRSDQFTSGSFLVGLEWNLSSRFEVDLYAGTSRLAPDYQALYWSSSRFKGNSTLPAEHTQHSGIHLQRNFFGWLHTETQMEIRRSVDAPFINQEGRFSSTESVSSLAGLFSLHVNQPKIEVGLHAWSKKYVDVGQDDYSAWLDAMGAQTMIQAEFFLKGPIYNQAAYTKAGVMARWVPSNERGPAFEPLLNRWMHGTDSRILPAYGVVDFHVSTRLRWMMIYLQLENALNGIGQHGYFESPGYPMSGRRFIFGIHVLFKN